MNYNRDPRRVFWYGLTVMFILIGIAAVLSVIFNPHTFPSTFSGWIGVAGSVAGVLIGLFILLISLPEYFQCIIMVRPSPVVVRIP